ncbi:MAG TPA: hypothetical protein VER37_03955, partial [Thermomicrobiales bacterium]|nr:hypothetical protein [Thermomicrobiales bacterium]
MADLDADQSLPAARPPVVPPEPPATRRGLGGRPFSVYLVLAAGLVILAVLLALVVITRRDDDGPPPPICLSVTAAEAERDVNGGLVEQVNVLTEEGRPETGPLAVTLDLVDGNCRELPEGIAAQPDFYRLIGLVTVYNQTRAGEQRILLSWRQQGNIPAALLATPTATTTVTETPTPAPSPTATTQPTAAPRPAPPLVATPARPEATPSPVPTAVRTSVAPASPVATPTPRPTTRAAPPRLTIRATTSERERTAVPAPPNLPTASPGP